MQIGINLTDPIFRGEYHGTQRHEDDFEDVIQRGLDAGCKKFMVTGSDLKESEHAVEIAKAHRKQRTLTPQTRAPADILPRSRPLLCDRRRAPLLRKTLRRAPIRPGRAPQIPQGACSHRKGSRPRRRLWRIRSGLRPPFLDGQGAPAQVLRGAALHRGRSPIAPVPPLASGRRRFRAFATREAGRASEEGARPLVYRYGRGDAEDRGYGV